MNSMKEYRGMMRQANTEPVLDEKLGYVTYALSAVVAVCVLLARLCQPLLPYRPRWTKSFIEELSKHGEVLDLDHKMYSSRLSTTLLVLVPTSLALQVATVLFPSVTYAAILQLTALVSLPVDSEVIYLTSFRQ